PSGSPRPKDPLRGCTLIGVAERIDLPEWDIDQLRVKIDTGARTSALHVDDIEELPDGRVRFWVILDRKHAHRRVQVEAPVSRRSRVRSSSGKAQERIFVSTRMKLGPVEKEIEVSLASREPMIFRMLLGRSALHHDFLVDPSHRYLQSPKAKREKRSSKRRGKKKSARSKKQTAKKEAADR
ncbi:MAG TPA: RimK/LysX family protein, partial [Sandaracinaceae bacterium LLY-WYZ-13_1]|nr:RimK/LysX family protein [Sandaracinaceae bacterium LLY-WYZ-13_1]